MTEEPAGGDERWRSARPLMVQAAREHGLDVVPVFARVMQALCDDLLGEEEFADHVRALVHGGEWERVADALDRLERRDRPATLAAAGARGRGR